MDDIPELRAQEIADAVELASRIVDQGDGSTGELDNRRSLRELAIRLHAVLNSGSRDPIQSVADLRLRIEDARSHEDSEVAESARILVEFDTDTLLEALTVVRANRGEQN
jgi:hypothetical protein